MHLRRETDRLIDSAGFDRFVKNFAGYWLNLRHLRRDDPDKRLYPEYQLDEYLIDSLERETLAFITAMVRDNLPIRNLVDADFLYVNERLARHYELEPVYGAAMRRVAVPKGSPLGGLLTQGAILKVTANGTSTSPVLRGAWIMDRILGEPPTPPPPGVPAVEPDIRGAKTIRDLLAMHTKSSTCASCHAKFDPRRTGSGELRRGGPLADSLPGHRRRRARQRHRPHRARLCLHHRRRRGCERYAGRWTAVSATSAT